MRTLRSNPSTSVAGDVATRAADVETHGNPARFAASTRAQSLPAPRSLDALSDEAKAALKLLGTGDFDVVSSGKSGVAFENLSLPAAQFVATLLGMQGESPKTTYTVMPANTVPSDRDVALRKAKELESFISSQPDVGPAVLKDPRTGDAMVFAGPGAAYRAVMALFKGKEMGRAQIVGGAKDGAGVLGSLSYPLERNKNYDENGFDAMTRTRWIPWSKPADASVFNLGQGDHAEVWFALATRLQPELAREVEKAVAFLAGMPGSERDAYLPYPEAVPQTAQVSSAVADNFDARATVDDGAIYSDGYELFTGAQSFLKALRRTRKQSDVHVIETVRKLEEATTPDRPVRLAYASREELQKVVDEQGDKPAYGVDFGHLQRGGMLVYATQEAARACFESQARWGRASSSGVILALLKNFLAPLEPYYGGVPRWSFNYLKM